MQVLKAFGRWRIKQAWSTHIMKKKTGLLLAIGIWKPNLIVSFLMGFLADLWEYCPLPTSLSQKQLWLCAKQAIQFDLGSEHTGTFQYPSHFAKSISWLTRGVKVLMIRELYYPEGQQPSGMTVWKLKDPRTFALDG